jgi:hypothetical protein
MKFKVTLKDPDTLSDACNEAATTDVASLIGVTDDERESIAKARADLAYGVCVKKWFDYGEYLTVEIDTEARTCIVVDK